ncbi:MAG: PfkB family carbohydrate kinase [Spirochaetota bacterium]
MIVTVCLNPVLQKTIVLPAYIEGEVNRSSEHYFYLSGKGVNVSRVLSELGEKTAHITFSGGMFDMIFRSLAVRERYPIIAVPAKTELRFCYTLLNRKDGSATEIVEEGSPVDSTTGTKVLAAFRKELPRAHAVVISGTRAPGFRADIMPTLVTLAKTAGKTVLIDFRGRDLLASMHCRPDFIKINRYEFSQTFMGGRTAGLERTMLAVSKDSGARVILTDGKKAIHYTDDGVVKTLSPTRITAVNPIGSGDSFAAGFISQYLRTGSVAQAVRKAEWCARRNAERLMAGTIR